MLIKRVYSKVLVGPTELRRNFLLGNCIFNGGSIFKFSLYEGVK